MGHRAGRGQVVAADESDAAGRKRDVDRTYGTGKPRGVDREGPVAGRGGVVRRGDDVAGGDTAFEATTAKLDPSKKLSDD